MLRKPHPVISKSVLLSMLLLSTMMFIECNDGESVSADKTLNATERIWAAIIPVKGTLTAYEVSLSLENNPTLDLSTVLFQRM